MPLQLSNMNNRRNFLKKITWGAGFASLGLPHFANAKSPSSSLDADESSLAYAGKQSFNMCGFTAPKLDKVRIGFIGLGNRGPGAVSRMSLIEGVEIVALCDKDPKRASAQQAKLEKAGRPKAKEYSGQDGWKALCESNDIDLVYIATPWSLHTPMAVYAMNQGKHTAIEVPAAKTIDECWQLVETSEKTKRHCMMLENCCYDFFEQLTLNMVRNGMFGELVHAEGAYVHNLIDSNFGKTSYSDMWRLRENMRNGNLYPTHGLGPIAQCLDINRGDKFDHLVSISTNDFQMAARAKEEAAKDAFYNEFAGKTYRGNMNNTIIRTNKGKTVLLQHDVTSTRPYSRIHLLSGTKGMAQKWPDPVRIALGESWVKEAELKELEAKFITPLVKHIGEIAKKVGGHGGMDFIMDWRLIDCLRNGLPLDQDVYDAASWSVIAPLSEQSVAKKGKTVDVPDFTRGAWKSNKPVSLSLEGGATTEVKRAQ
ncbi:Gfo/Idh/MocA family protein [Haliscomenobacter hydrossis]|uniref:Alpha-N-acetylgalactosaminidase n=1 Tax=Haliscomenobacter hydrossis (strain ATCC 27775 / DSM 1100 / LMG 10767 / O) TaxID=760192 RepID=F4L3S7_HALH1|nr:Gfo/Idh/MocA family oxidoreductase [Haliscomenobacter hydrossis]AEE48681.1 Alpha-N-acetylgalactosaminidase [Haliscomenobacter hydrossis DSM 1100]